MPINNAPILTAYSRLLTADTTKIFLPAVAGQRLYIVGIEVGSVTPAAQEVRIRLTTALTEVYRLGASIPVGVNDIMKDYFLPVSEGLQADPVAAGPSISFFVRYQVIS